jgi:hypothetical protein
MNAHIRSIKRQIGNDNRWLTAIHVFCLLICGVLGFACYYLANQPNEIINEFIELPMPIDEAERLIATADNWRHDYEIEKEREGFLRDRAKQVIKWLPVQRDWSHSMQDVQTLAEQCDLELIEMSPGEVFKGARVDVQSAICQLQGSYPAFCRFLDGLTKMNSPIWASELTMQNDASSGTLTLTTHLRLPIAGSDTAGAYLISLVGDSSATPPQNSTIANSVAVRGKESENGR